MKSLTSDQIMDKFYMKSYKRQSEILLNAIGLMQSCNSQSIEHVIALSMEYNLDNGKYYKA